jgi:hypothetical protein
VNRAPTLFELSYKLAHAIAWILSDVFVADHVSAGVAGIETTVMLPTPICMSCMRSAFVLSMGFGMTLICIATINYVLTAEKRPN